MKQGTAPPITGNNGQGNNVRILILGGTGMLGHKMFQVLASRFSDTFVTLHGSLDSKRLRSITIFRSPRVIPNVNAADFLVLNDLLRDYRPDVVINCVGIIKQRPEAHSAGACVTINALLPHVLAQVCVQVGAKLIHFSTDCVFSGRKGNYREDDVADAEDLYGRTKYLGEVRCKHSLTLRTSIIGRELFHRQSLLEWFLTHNHGRVSGYRRALYSGVTTNQLAAVVGDLIEHHLDLAGVYQVTSSPISKYDLLKIIADQFKLDIHIAPNDEFVCDRSMCGDRFRHATGYVAPCWPELINQLASDPTPYEQWRIPNEAISR